MSTKIYRSSLYPKLASMGQLASANDNILNNSTAQEGRGRFENVMNSIIQRNKEENAANPAVMNINQRPLYGNIQKESFELPNVVGNQTTIGKINRELVKNLNTIDLDEAAPSGHLITNNCAIDPTLEMKKRVMTVSMIIIVVLLLFAFFNLHLLQNRIEEVMNDDLDIR